MAFNFQNPSKLNWIIIFIIILIMAILRPIHQDDGWYASFALRMLGNWNIVGNVSFFSFFDSNGNDNPGGFLFSILQLPFYAVFGISVLSARIFNALVITALLYVIHIILKTVAPSFRWIAIVLLIVHPVFYYHFYNRPESLALLLALLSMYLLITAEGSAFKTFVGYFIWAFILDVHPIAIFSVFGVGLYYWFNHKHFTKFVVSGGLAGLIAYLGLSYVLNGTFGLLDSLFMPRQANFGDHYVPIFQSDLNDYVRIALLRFDTLKATILFSLIWVILPMFFIRKCKFHGYVRLATVNFIGFWILAIFASEAYSNGFGLYSIVNFFLIWAVLFQSVLDTYKIPQYWNWILVFPFFAFSLKNTALSLKTHAQYYSTFNKSYDEVKNCIPNGAKVLMRPTFAFNMGQKSLHVDYTFGIMNVMADKNISFEEAIKLREYDFVVLDEKNLKEELLLDVRDNSLFQTPAYIKYLNVGIKANGFDSLLQSGFLNEVCVFDEASHGKTRFYKVAK